MQKVLCDYVCVCVRVMGRFRGRVIYSLYSIKTITPIRYPSKRVCGEDGCHGYIDDVIPSAPWRLYVLWLWWRAANTLGKPPKLTKTPKRSFREELKLCNQTQRCL